MVFERDPHKLYPHDRLMAKTIIRLVPSFVTPNTITWLRFLMIPIVLYLLLVKDYAAGVPFFILAAFSDALDGSLARVRNQITDWGTFYDPLADKLLITSVVLFVVIQYINPIFGFIILGLELILLFGGIIRKRRGQVVSANVIGKTKMFLQFLGVTFLLVAVWSGIDLFIPFSIATLSLAIVCAVVSIITYGL